MELSEAIRGRRAVRTYTAEPVDKADIDVLIEAAIQAPSAMNEQPWVFHVISDQALLTEISNHAKRHMLQSTPAGAASHHFESTLADESFHIFYHAPVVFLICAAAEGPWTTIDCSLAAQNLMLAAHERGLGSCWIGFAQAWLNTPAGKAPLGIGAAELPVAPIAIGHPAAATPPVARRPAHVVWHGPVA